MNKSEKEELERQDRINSHSKMIICKNYGLKNGWLVLKEKEDTIQMVTPQGLLIEICLKVESECLIHVIDGIHF